jgi:hypothetical protein
MSVIPPHFAVDVQSVRWQALGKLATLVDTYVGYRRIDSKDAQELLLKITKIRLWLKALDYSDYLSQEQVNKIVSCLISLSGIYEFPTAPVLANVARPAILIGGSGGTTTVTNNYDAGTPAENSDIDIGTETIDTFATSLCSSVVWHYTVTNGTVQRGGLFGASWIGSTIDTWEQSGPDLVGSTSDLVLSADISAGNVRLRGTAASNNWSVTVRRYLVNNG